jgi:hypothetical protein
VTVLVSVTYYPPAAPYVRRAVESVLAQTHTDLVCVVIGDGAEPPLSGIRDDRLIVHTYPKNRGAYFAQDVAIWASPYEWYAPVAADDWIDPNHIEKLLAQGGDRCSGGVRYHNDHYCADDPTHVRCSGTPVPAGFAHGDRKAYEVGIYRTRRYHEIGAHNPNERLGQDSLTLKVMRIVAPVGVSDHMTYNRLGRVGSLCTDPATSRDSPARRAMRLRNRQIVAQCQRLRSAARIKAYRESLVPREVRDALAREVEGLRAKVGQAVAV